MKYLNLGLSFLSLLFLCSCASNNYEKFYSSNDIPENTWKKNNTPNVALIEIDDLNDVLDWEENGYCILGTSEFYGRWQSRAWAIDQARHIGATHVLVHFDTPDISEKTSTIIVPTAQTTYHHGTVFGAQGTVNYSGTSTSYSSTPVTISETCANWNQTAIFLAPLAQLPAFGVGYEPLPNVPGQEDRPVKIQLVFKDSEAQRQGIRRGDTVISINGKPIPNYKALHDFLESHEELREMEVRHEN